MTSRSAVRFKKDRYTICFLSTLHPPLDKRVFAKEATSLVGAGYRVIHVAPGSGVKSRRNGVEIVTYRASRGPLNRLRNVLHLGAKVWGIPANAFHCNEVDSWLLAVLLCLYRPRHVVFDVHEDYPGMVSERHSNRLVRSAIACAIRLLFRILEPFTDRFVLAKASLTDDFAWCQRKVVVARNFAQLSSQSIAPKLGPKTDLGSPADNTVRVIHIGQMSRIRCWPQLLTAIQHVKKCHVQLRFFGEFGDGSRPDFDRMVNVLGLAENVIVYPRIDMNRLANELSRADIGVCLLEPGYSNHIKALPHKVFDYMLGGLPIIAPSFAHEVAEIVKKEACGLLINTGDTQEIARAIDELAQCPDRRHRMGANGRRAVVDTYNWEVECENLLAMYNELRTTDAARAVSC